MAGPCLDVHLDGLTRQLARRGHEGAPSPQRWETEVLLVPDDAGRVALDLLDELVRCELRMSRDEQGNVVGLDRQLDDFEVQHVGFLPHERFEPVGHVTREDLLPVVRAPDEVGGQGLGVGPLPARSSGHTVEIRPLSANAIYPSNPGHAFDGGRGGEVTDSFQG